MEQIDGNGVVKDVWSNCEVESRERYFRDHSADFYSSVQEADVQAIQVPYGCVRDWKSCTPGEGQQKS